MKRYNLVGQRVTITLKNSHVFTGEVYKIADDDLLLKSKSGSLLIIRNISENVITILLHSNTESKPQTAKTLVNQTPKFTEPGLEPPQSDDMDELVQRRVQAIAGLKRDLASFLNKKQLDIQKADDYLVAARYDPMAILKNIKK